MGDFRISGKNVITQSGTDEPVLASNVTLGTGMIKPSAIPNATTSTLSCTTASSTTVTTADTSSLSLGMGVSGTGIPSGAHIATIPNSTTFTISAAATNSATNTLTFRTGITDSKLNFSGTVDNTTFLRSDKTWATAGSPSITDGGNATAITIDSSEDVTFEKRAIIPSLKPKSNQNLTGTYADHEMIMGDKFTLTGDLTINDNLVLASLSGSGQDIIIEDDGNGRTITTAGKVISCTTTNTDATVTTADTSDLRAGTGVTGTGVPAGATIASVTNATTFELSAAATASGTVNLTFDTAVFEAGEFLGTAGLPSLTDLTGELKSTVTGSPAINLQNATYPKGHIVNTWFWGPYSFTSDLSQTITSTKTTVNFGASVGGDMQITGITATEGNLLQIIAHPGDLFCNNDGSYNTDIGPEIDGTWYTTTSVYYYKSTGQVTPVTTTLLYVVPASFTNKTIKVRHAKQGGSGTHQLYCRSFQGSSHSIHMTVFEIQQ